MRWLAGLAEGKGTRKRFAEAVAAIRSGCSACRREGVDASLASSEANRELSTTGLLSGTAGAAGSGSRALRGVGSGNAASASRVSLAAGRCCGAVGFGMVFRASANWLLLCCSTADSTGLGARPRASAVSMREVRAATSGSLAAVVEATSLTGAGGRKVVELAARSG